jgi:hypothetical protein
MIWAEMFTILNYKITKVFPIGPEKTSPRIAISTALIEHAEIVLLESLPGRPVSVRHINDRLGAP